MDVIKAARATAQAVMNSPADFNGKPYYLNSFHLLYMLGKIERGEVTGEKAHRWLGWMQAAVYGAGVLSHEQLQQINKDS